MIDTVNGLRTPLDCELKTRSLEFLLQRSNKRCNISIALCFLLIERMGNILVGLVIKEFERQILHLRLNGIQTQSVCQRSMQLFCFARHMATTIRVALLIHCTKLIQSFEQDFIQYLITILVRHIIA